MTKKRIKKRKKVIQKTTVLTDEYDKASSLIDSIFYSEKSNSEKKSTSSSSLSLFDNPIMVPLKVNKPTTTKNDINNGMKRGIDGDSRHDARRALKNRKYRSERHLFRKALDFPGVFDNEEQKEENGFVLIADEYERTKETADAVRDHGFCVIRNVVGGENDKTRHPLDVVLPAAKILQGKLKEALDNRGIDHCTDMFRFREASSRCKGRTDVVFDMFKDESMADIRQTILRNPKVYPVIKNLLGVPDCGSDDESNEDIKLIYAGLILSHPGSCEQPWHQDGPKLFPELRQQQSTLLQASLPPYAVNVFLPLEDESIVRGPTEFLPGSHKWSSPDDRLRTVNDKDGDENGCDSTDDAAIIAPLLKRGDALIYDYRVCHRGTANLFDRVELSNGSAAITSMMMKKKKKLRNDKRGNNGAISTCICNTATHTNDSNGSVKGENIDIGTRRILYLLFARPWFTDHVNFDFTESAESLFEIKL
mmetsp:Transcript_28157/g.32378  ORF Transcript_28157/g.32378 Transcript_28157/m.32378 type:complete len:479 (-) Transcript_28157:585-2021(-)